MVNYQKGKIYAIRSYQTDDIYIGSTVDTLSKRMGGHRCNYKQYIAGKKVGNLTSFKILKYNDAYIELLEDYPCNSKGELERKEGEYIRKMDCVNKVIAGRSQEEYRALYDDKIKEYQRNANLKNKARQLAMNQSIKLLENGLMEEYLRFNKKRDMWIEKKIKYLKMEMEIKEMKERNDELDRQSDKLDQRAREIGLI